MSVEEGIRGDRVRGQTGCVHVRFGRVCTSSIATSLAYSHKNEEGLRELTLTPLENDSLAH